MWLLFQATPALLTPREVVEAHRFRRLPVVDKGKLVGIVTERKLESVSPSKATSLTVWELSYLLNKTSVKEIMERHVVTISPDMTAEEATALVQSNKVGSMVVIEDDRVVGIVTTNDFFYKIINPLLGLGQPGSRVEISGGGEGKALEEIISVANNLGLEITTLHIEHLPETTKKDLCVHINSDIASKLVTELKKRKYKVDLRKR